MAQNIKSHKYNIDPLNGNNYEAWKFRVQTVLIEHDVDKLITERYTPEAYAEQNNREAERKKDNKCKSIILQCIEDR